MSPADHHHQLNEQFARFLVIGCAALLILRLIIAPLPAVLLLAALLCLLWMTLLYILIRHEYLVGTASYALVYSLLGWLTLILCISGGAQSALIYSFPMIPMLGGLMLSRRHTLAITAYAVLLLLGLIELERMGFRFELPATSIPAAEELKALWITASVIVAAVVALYFAQQNEQLANALRDEARVDFLTRIANRRGLEEELNRQRKAVSLRDAWLSVLMVDIDHFKRYNDQYGHSQGDSCLAGIASLLTSWTTSRGGFVGRYGGEEFMVILPDMDPRSAFEAGQEIRVLIEVSSPNLSPPGQRRALTATVGVSSLRGSELGDSPASLVEAADQALYLGKAQGRNRVVEQAALPANLSIDLEPDLFESGRLPD